MEIFYIFACFTILGLIAYGLQIWAVRLTLNSSNCSNGSNSFYPPISILKPLKGLDDNLFDNLTSFCNQDYPEYEIIFSLQDYNDPAYKVAKKIKDKYPKIPISIIVEQCNLGLNPKINNLIPAYRASKYDYVLISDSNVMVDENYLKDIAKYMEDPEIGLVCNIIKGVGGNSIGSILENLHLNSFIVGSVCFLDRFFKMPCVIGKSMLMRKRDLDVIGGLNSVKDFLAEDYIIGKKIHKKGKKVILSTHIIKNVNEYWGIKRFINRHTRWGKLRWKIGGIKYISELISNPVFFSFLPIFIWEASKVTLLFGFFVSIIKVIGDFYLGKRLGSTIKSLHYLISPVKDIFIGIIWFVPLFSNTVVWRGNRYFIGKDSKLLPYLEKEIGGWKYKIFDAIRALKTRVPQTP